MSGPYTQQEVETLCRIAYVKGHMNGQASILDYVLQQVGERFSQYSLAPEELAAGDVIATALANAANAANDRNRSNTSWDNERHSKLIFRFDYPPCQPVSLDEVLKRSFKIFRKGAG